MIEGTTVPDLRIAVNGKYGMFYLHPKLDYTMGDIDNAQDPHYSYAEVNVSFPGSYLQQGTNFISVQTLQEGLRESPDPRGLTYDAIELDVDSAPFDAALTTADAEPTVFFKEIDGQLNEMVNVFIRYAQSPGKGSSIGLTIGGKSYRRPLVENQDFGEEKITFAVPEFTAQTAKLE